MVSTAMHVEGQALGQAGPMRKRGPSQFPVIPMTVGTAQCPSPQLLHPCLCVAQTWEHTPQLYLDSQNFLPLLLGPSVMDCISV